MRVITVIPGFALRGRHLVLALPLFCLNLLLLRTFYIAKESAIDIGVDAHTLDALTRRGLSQRKACCYLGFSRRVPAYTLKQQGKDCGLVVSEEVMRTSSVEHAQAEHPEATTTPTALRQRYSPTGPHPP